MTSYISSPDALEALVGKSSPVIDLKVIDYLDEHAMAWLHSSTFAGVAFAGKGEPPVLTIAAGAAGFAVPTTLNELTIPSEALDQFNGVEEALVSRLSFLCRALARRCASMASFCRQVMPSYIFVLQSATFTALRH